MPQLLVPVTHQVLWSTGDVRLWLSLDLDIEDGTGNFVPDAFRVDSATDISTFPAYRARVLNLPMPRNPSPGAVHAQTGLEGRSGLLRFRIVALDLTEYAIPCLFLGDPNVPPTSGRSASSPRNLLQPLHLLDHLRFTMEKGLAHGSPYGDLVVETK